VWRYLRGVVLGDRWHAHPPLELVNGKLRLVDVATGEELAYQLNGHHLAGQTVPDAAERLGLARGCQLYGVFEVPTVCGATWQFLATAVPAWGTGPTAWCRRRRRRASRPHAGPAVRAAEAAIENSSTACRRPGLPAGVVTSRQGASRDLFDPAAEHGFGELVVRGPLSDEQFTLEACDWTAPPGGPVSACLELTAARTAIRRCARPSPHLSPRFATRILKDPTPLLDVHLAFPFQSLGRHPALPHTEGGAERPGAGGGPTCPGANWDSVAVQNW